MPKDEAYWKRKLEELELDMPSKSTQKSAIPNQNPTPPSGELPQAPSLAGIYQQSRAWFETLPNLGKGAVILGGTVLSLSVVRTLVQVVTFSLSFGLFLILAYGAYRFLNQNRSND